MMREQPTTCHRLFSHLSVYRQQRFTGKLTVASTEGIRWELYLIWGQLAWASGGLHPRRRWRRQYFLATGNIPTPAILSATEDGWDYSALCDWAAGGAKPELVKQAILGVLGEVLFEIVQTFEAPLSEQISRRGSQLPLSVLEGIGDGMAIAPLAGATPRSEHRFPQTWLPDFDDLQVEIQRCWRQWAYLGLAAISPNDALYVRDRSLLKASTATKVYRSLANVLNGKRTIRDIAIKIVADRNILSLARASAASIRSGAIGVQPTADLSVERSPARPSTPTLLPLIISIGNDSAIAAEIEAAGYAYLNFNNGFEALHSLNQPDVPLPSALLINEDAGVLSGFEVCGVLRRIETFREIPIAIYSETFDSGDRKRVRKAYQAGANCFFGAHELDGQHLSDLVEAISTANAQATSRLSKPRLTIAVEEFMTQPLFTERHSNLTATGRSAS